MCKGTAGLSSRSKTGTIAMRGDCATIAELAAEHTGQMCEAEGFGVKSAQKWNCAARKTIPRNNAKNRIRDDLPGM
jgi:hypothetical protein